MTAEIMQKFYSDLHSVRAKGPVRLFREKARRPLGTPLAKTILLWVIICC